jgi:phosphotransferase system HPr (HPr) family protein
VETRSIFFIPRKKVISRTHIIKNKFGLHTRPSASFMQTAMRYRSEIKVEKDGQVADGKSIMDLMMLAAFDKNSLWGELNIQEGQLCFKGILAQNLGFVCRPFQGELGGILGVEAGRGAFNHWARLDRRF